jgi:protein-tyrosine phosphatase
METKSRILNWEACLNARELGGYPARDGRRLRWNALVRSDSSALLTVAGEQALLDYGVRTAIDLRFAHELEMAPSPLAKIPESQITYLNIPLNTDQDVDSTMMADPTGAVSDLYVRLLETNRGHIALVLTVIAQAREGGVLFHCHAGKDRTGLIAACLLGLLGVSEEDIVRDYSFASAQLKAFRETAPFDPGTSAEEREYLRVMWSAQPETMRRTLQYLQVKYGGVAGYLRTTPLQDAAARTLRERLLEG